MQSDVVIIGAGLAGLVAANELVARGKTVTILDQRRGVRTLAAKRSGPWAVC